MTGTATGTTTASFNWIQPDPSLQNGIIVYYTVELTDLTFGRPDHVYNTTLTSFNFTGLEEYARYSFRVAAGTAVGIGPLSTSLQIMTLEDGRFKDDDHVTIPCTYVNPEILHCAICSCYFSPPKQYDFCCIFIRFLLYFLPSF